MRVGRGWIDISVPLRTGMVHWPDDPPVRIERFQSFENGDGCNVSALSMSAHTGTHVDAPFHFAAAGEGVDAMPFSATIGPARVIAIRGREAVRPEELRAHRIRRGERVLFKTPGSARRWKSGAFEDDFVYISKEAALFLAERQVRCVGIDYLSVGGFRKDLTETHEILLGAGIWVIEGLDLSRVKPGRYELICLPLRIAGADGAPARALLRPAGRGPYQDSCL
jgi:arylformamidase